MRTYFIETWGCQMNRHDSEAIEGQLRAVGLRAAAAAGTAELVVLNTCSVRERPVHKLLSRIGTLARLEPTPTIGVCGCVAEQEGARLLESSPAVGFVLGPGQGGRVGEAVRALASGGRTLAVGFEPGGGQRSDLVIRASRTRAMVTVVEGCDEFCTFCVVPHTRGRERARPLATILDQVRRLASEGVQEVELLGQTINAYRCPDTGAHFADLLEAVADLHAFARVRYITSHPRHFSDRLIEVLAANRRLSRYLHLPFQAGSDRVLARMHRRYTRATYLELVERIRARVPGVNLSTDVIVGFPGESEDDFEQTLDLLARVRFGQVFAFAYSPRPRTPAARYPGQLDEQTKRGRLHRLFELTETISLELNRGLVGRTVEVLIDGESRRSPDDWQGRSEDNRVVNFPKSGEHGVGDLVAVEITAAGAHSLVGRAPRPTVCLPVLGPSREPVGTPSA